MKKDNMSELMNLIKEIEFDYPVQSWKINNIDMWPIFRIITTFNLIKANSNSKEIPLELEEHPKEMPNVTSLLCKKEHADFLFFSDSQYRVNINGIWYNRLSDPFYEEVVRQGFKAINLDFSFQNAGKFPTLNDTYALQNQLIYKKKSKFSKELNIQLQQFETVRQKLIEATKLANIPTKDSLIYIAKEMMFWISIFKEILINKKIKYAFIVNFYQIISQSLIFACRELGIPTVDIQHGNQRDLIYHSWTNISLEGYNTLPNYFWVWTEQFAEPIRNWILNNEQHHVIVGGNPWLEMWKQDSNRNVKKYNSIVKKFASKGQINILITLQPKYGLSNWKTNIPDSLLQVIKDSPSNYKFFVRYHQQMLHKYVDEKNECEKFLEEFIRQGKVETKLATSLPLPALLKVTDIHITAHSTCAVEAKEFNVPSITLHPEAVIIYKKEIESGWVIQAKTKEEILYAINKQIQFKEKSSHHKKSLSLFTSALNEITSKSYHLKHNNYSINKEVLVRIYFIDKEYKKIIDCYEDNDPYLIDLFVASAYHELGDFDKEKKYYITAINKAILEDTNFDDIDLICNVLNITINEKSYETISKKIIFLLNKNSEMLGKVLWQLFNNQNFDSILELCRNLNRQTLDSLYYEGRVYSSRNNPKDAISKLTKYINLYNTAYKSNITCTKNFLISAYYYIGKNYYELGENKSAIFYIEKCIENSEGTHIKAYELLNKIKNN